MGHADTARTPMLLMSCRWSVVSTKIQAAHTADPGVYYFKDFAPSIDGINEGFRGCPGAYTTRLALTLAHPHRPPLPPPRPSPQVLQRRRVHVLEGLQGPRDCARLQGRPGRLLLAGRGVRLQGGRRPQQGVQGCALRHRSDRRPLRRHLPPPERVRRPVRRRVRQTAAPSAPSRPHAAPPSPLFLRPHPAAATSST